jgi:hypothetical protein
LVIPSGVIKKKNRMDMPEIVLIIAVAVFSASIVERLVELRVGEG